MNDAELGLPDVISVQHEGHRCVLALHVPMNCKWFVGHFDEAPILSGVAQMDWVMTLAQRYLGLNQKFSGIQALKFQQVIKPGTELEMALEWDPSKQVLRFEMAGGSRYSSGRIILHSATAE